jgi:hypothetical protein
MTSSLEGIQPQILDTHQRLNNSALVDALSEQFGVITEEKLTPLVHSLMKKAQDNADLQGLGANKKIWANDITAQLLKKQFPQEKDHPKIDKMLGKAGKIIDDSKAIYKEFKDLKPTDEGYTQKEMRQKIDELFNRYKDGIQEHEIFTVMKDLYEIIVKGPKTDPQVFYRLVMNIAKTELGKIFAKTGAKQEDILLILNTVEKALTMIFMAAGGFKAMQELAGKVTKCCRDKCCTIV